MTMTPAEKADKAKQILELIDQDVRHAIILRAYFCRGAYDGDDVRKRFDNTEAGRGFKIVLDSLYRELILTTARLFDDPKKDKSTGKYKDTEKTASIPVLIELLSDGETQSELQARSIARKIPKEVNGRPPDKSTIAQFRTEAIPLAEEETRKIKTLVSEYATLKGNHLIANISAARNNLFAHTSLEPNKNNRAAYGNAESLLDKTIPFVTSLQRAVLSCHPLLDDYRHMWEKQADIFWKALACGKPEAPSFGPPAPT